GPGVAPVAGWVAVERDLARAAAGRPLVDARRGEDVPRLAAEQRPADLEPVRNPPGVASAGENDETGVVAALRRRVGMRRERQLARDRDRRGNGQREVAGRLLRANSDRPVARAAA